MKIKEFLINAFYILGHLLRKYINDCQKTKVDEFLTTESNFYEKYMRLDDFLDNAEFINKFYPGSYCNGKIVLYKLDSTVIYITNNGAGTIKACRIDNLWLVYESSYYPYMYGLQYQKRSILKKNIYDDFKNYLDPNYKHNVDCNVQKGNFYVHNGKGR